MTCGLYEGIDIHFLSSGLHVTPYEVSTRSNHKEFSYTKCKISREDGEKIATEAAEYEPVSLSFDGVVQDRYMFHPEAVSLHNEDATLTLYDAERVLDVSGTVNHHFSDTTLRDVITFLVDEREDPNGVITGIKHLSEFVQEGRFLDEVTEGRDGVTGFLEKAASKFSEMLTGMDQHDTSLRVKEETPYGGIKKATNAAGLSTWVDTDGQFCYALRGAGKDSYMLQADSSRFRLKEYNVNIGSGKLSQIVLHGGFEYTSRGIAGESDHTRRGLHSYGKAWLVDENGEKVAGRTETPEDPVSVTSPQAVEDVARAQLIQHYMGRRSGNIVLNSGASNDKEALAHIAVGDLISAEAEIEEHCHRKVDTGLFIIQSVKHNLDTRRGWLTDLAVAGLPFEDIESESWVADPERDDRWESVREYYNDKHSSGELVE